MNRLAHAARVLARIYEASSSAPVPVDQVRTWPGLVSTTARLMGKAWLTATDWDVLLEGAASGHGRRVTRGVMREAS